VSQTGTTTTYFYPFKWYSVASSTGSGAKYATTTDYVFNGDSLVATVDQQTASGNATGTAKTRYIHPDHLGSTNVVTDENDAVVQTLDYYPYGGTHVLVVHAVDDDLLAVADELADDDALVGRITGNPVGCEEMHHIEHVRLQIGAQLFKPWASEQRPGVAVH
jgi:hypothetical protein